MVFMRQTQSKETKLQEAVGLLYEAATSPDGWISALDHLCPIFNCLAAHYFLWNKALDRPVASHVSTSYLGQKKALQYYLRIDPRRMLLARSPVGATLLCQEHFDEVFVEKNEYFQDYSLPLGRRFLMATNLIQIGPTSSVFALLRSPQEGPFESKELALLERFRPDLDRVARMHWRFLQARHEGELGQSLLDGLPTCVIATDPAGGVVRLNQAAIAMLHDGSVLRVVSGRLIASMPAQTKTLHQLIRQVTAAVDPNAPNASCTIVEDRFGSRYGVMITRLRDHPMEMANTSDPIALITVNSLEQQAGSDRTLIRIFGLTPTEAKLASDVAAGRRLDTLAKERGVRMSTLRTQMRSIYSKTRTSRQAELAHLITSLPKLPDDVADRLRMPHDSEGVAAPFDAHRVRTGGAASPRLVLGRP